MRKKILVLIAIAALAAGAAFLVDPTTSHAGPVTVLDVTVSIGATPPSPFSLWDGACGLGTCLPVVLPAFGSTLVLAQTAGFNFDTSELPAPVAGRPAPTITVTTNLGVAVFTDTGLVLTLANADPVSTAFNEAQDYVSLGTDSTGTYELLVAYADTAHTDVCGSGATAVGLVGDPDCLPSPFAGATFFISAGTPLGNGFVTTNPFHCRTTGNPATTPCWDSGVILIRNIQQPPLVPEPSTLLLLGVGLSGVAGLAAWRRRRS